MQRAAPPRRDGARLQLRRRDQLYIKRRIKVDTDAGPPTKNGHNGGSTTAADYHFYRLSLYWLPVTA